MLFRDVAPGVHRIEDSFTNWYLLEDDQGITIVDAGVPSSWDSLQDALNQLGRSDVRALVLTHAHFDHVGFAERARRELRIPVYVHTNDAPTTRHAESSWASTAARSRHRAQYAWVERKPQTTSRSTRPGSSSYSMPPSASGPRLLTADILTTRLVTPDRREGARGGCGHLPAGRRGSPPTDRRHPHLAARPAP